MDTKDKIVHVGAQIWKLPEVLQFRRQETLFPHDMYFYEAKEFRSPKKGEYYISGAIPEVYKAPNDLANEFLIAVPTHKAKQVKVWVKVEGRSLYRVDVVDSP